jgi:DNA-binding transcriptional MerR regulator
MTVAAERPAFSIGEVARRVGVTKDAIRKAEREERIPRAQREEGGDDRLYYAEDIDDLRRYFHRR